ncbi:MAG: flagellar biosynthetic protein FliO [Candidatus Lindowbacteria bacterium]|nr:flagellar biosynthetic protein FliO [Candidatus Lindowbacteria bacterium]
MKTKPAAVLLLCLALLLASSFAASAAGDRPPESQRGANASPSAIEDKGAGYLPYSEPSPLGSGGLLGAIVRTIFSLAIVIGMLYVVLWMIRKLMGSSAGPFSEGPIRVVGRVYLSPKIVVYFLKLVDELLVLGANAGNISLLATIKDEHEIAQIENALKHAQAQMPNLVFSRFFDKSLAKFQKTMEKEDSAFDDQLSKINDQIGRLKGLTRKKQRYDD